MTTTPEGQTPAYKGNEGMPQTPAVEGGDNKEQSEETYTKSQLTEKITAEIGKVTAKHSKKIETLMAELEAERRKNLPDPEKVKAEIADKDKKIAAKDQELSGQRLENAKLRALMKVGVDPEKVDALLKRVVGSTPEEIDADVLELKTLGLIAPIKKGLGTGTQTGKDGITEPSLDDQIAELQAKIHDPKTMPREKVKLAEKMTSLANRKMMNKGD